MEKKILKIDVSMAGMFVWHDYIKKKNDRGKHTE